MSRCRARQDPGSTSSRRGAEDTIAATPTTVDGGTPETDRLAAAIARRHREEIFEHVDAIDDRTGISTTGQGFK